MSAIVERSPRHRKATRREKRSRGVRVVHFTRRFFQKKKREERKKNEIKKIVDRQFGANTLIFDRVSGASGGKRTRRAVF